MKIKYIKTIGFRKFKKQFECNLYDITCITGGNRKGKTNILHAIVWAFLGTSLSGDDKVWLGNKKAEDCYVEIKFIDNLGEEHTLARYKNKYNNKKNFIMLDERTVSQEELQKFYSDKKLFLSILNVSYFINKKPSEQKELVDNYLPKIDVKLVYDKLEKEEQKMLEGIPRNIPLYLKELNEEISHVQKGITHLQGQINYAENIVNEKLESKQIFKKEEELSLAKQELSFLNADQIIANKEEKEKRVIDLEKQILQTENEILELNTTMQEGKKQYLAIKTEPISHCPMCEQEIKNEARIKTVSNLKAQLEGYYNKKVTLEAELKDIKIKHAMEKCKYHSLEGTSTVGKMERISVVESQILELETEKQDIQKYNNTISVKESNIMNARKDISIFEEKIKQHEKLIETIKETKRIAQKLYLNLIEERMKFVENYLTDVKIRFYSVLKTTGEIREDFIILYKGNELSSLSRSETIATSLELSNMFNHISRLNLPLFVDDSESCADYDFIRQYSDDTQVIISSVEKAKPLKISDYHSDAFSIYKPTIRGCKTIKITKPTFNITQKQVA